MNYTDFVGSRLIAKITKSSHKRTSDVITAMVGRGCLPAPAEMNFPDDQYLIPVCDVLKVVSELRPALAGSLVNFWLSYGGKCPLDIHEDIEDALMEVAALQDTIKRLKNTP